MEFEWDEAKRRNNLAKHGLDFADLDEFDWDHARITVDDRKTRIYEEKKERPRRL